MKKKNLAVLLVILSSLLFSLICLSSCENGEGEKSVQDTEEFEEFLTSIKDSLSKTVQLTSYKMNRNAEITSFFPSIDYDYSYSFEGSMIYVNSEETGEQIENIYTMNVDGDSFEVSEYYTDGKYYYNGDGSKYYTNTEIGPQARLYLENISFSKEGISSIEKESVSDNQEEKSNIVYYSLILQKKGEEKILRPVCSMFLIDYGNFSSVDIKELKLGINNEGYLTDIIADISGESTELGNGNISLKCELSLVEPGKKYSIDLPGFADYADYSNTEFGYN